MRKSLICAAQLAGGLLLKKLKYFEVMLNIFGFSQVWNYLESWLVYAAKFSWIAQPYISNDIYQLIQFFKEFLSLKCPTFRILTQWSGSLAMS